MTKGISPIALALGGGAALGWAHIGVLGVLAGAEVPIGAAAGTSIGALAALSLAAGRLDALEAIARLMTRRRMFGYLDPALERGAMLGGRRIARELRHHFGTIALEALPLPVALVAADLATGREVRLTRGPAIPSVLASMAIPGLFRPVAIDGRTLIDGGMVAPLPIAAARALAPALPLVSVDLLGDYRGHATTLAERPSALATMRSGFTMMIATIGRQAIALDPPEVTITLPIGHRSTGDFHRADELIALGAAAARAALPGIAAIAAAAG